MGLSESLETLLKFFCGGIQPDDQRPINQSGSYALSAFTESKPAVSHQPSPIFPPTQLRPPLYPQPQSHRHHPQSYNQQQSYPLLQPYHTEQSHKSSYTEQPSNKPAHEHKKQPSNKPAHEHEKRPSNKPAHEHEEHGLDDYGRQHPESDGVRQVYTAYTVTPAPARTPLPPSSPPSRLRSLGRPSESDYNQENKLNEFYVDLRKRAIAAGDQMKLFFMAASQAHKTHDHVRAKQLSAARKAAQKEMESLNMEVAEWIFRENNARSHPGEIDLHGLYVKEATLYADKAIQEAQARGDSKVRLIVGKGLHAKDGIPRIKPAIVKHMQKLKLVSELDEQNAGVLIVNLE